MSQQESKKFQAHVFRQRSRSVSKAVWPADLPRSLATGKAAQRRRAFILNGKWGALLTKKSAQAGVLLPVSVLSMCVGGAIVAALFWHLWYILLIPAVILLVSTLVVAPPLAEKVNDMLRSFAPPSARRKRRFSGFPSLATTRMMHAMQRTPETPLPVAPLVRILETFDLSQSNVEHFMDTPRSDNETPIPVHETTETNALQ
jgi:hypothetical protein